MQNNTRPRTPTPFKDIARGEAFVLLPTAPGEVVSKKRNVKLGGGWYHNGRDRYLLDDETYVRPVA